MSFRLRLTILTALAVAVAIVGTSLVVYYTDRHELIKQMDSDLVATERLPPVSGVLLYEEGPASNRVQSHGFVKSVTVAGNGPIGSSVGAGLKPTQIVLPGSDTAFQVNVLSNRTKRLIKAPMKATTSFANERVGPKRVWSRVLTVKTSVGGLRISRSLAEVDRNLSRLKWLLVLISGGGIGFAAVAGAFISRRAVAPLRKLTETTEQIVETGDLKRRVGRRGRDEISRLSTRLDELLATLDASLTAQRQLVADASHELRTPIAALRANLELLATPGSVTDGERTELLADVQTELEAMTTLVAELVELARGEETDVAPREFRLDEVAHAALERARKRATSVTFRSRLEPSIVVGVPERVERAVANLLDNAQKWSPAGGTVAVSVQDGVVEVRDEGPGIAEEDRPLVFNRFYRSAAARGQPGAGLGLAIVKQVADAHGGTVSVDGAPGGGAVLRLELSPTR
jgi:two-component system sensor histidine kinase MprB